LPLRVMDDLPDEMLWAIVSCAGPGALAALAMVSRRFYGMVRKDGKGDDLWARLCRRHPAFALDAPSSAKDTTSGGTLLERDHARYSTVHGRDARWVYMARTTALNMNNLLAPLLPSLCVVLSAMQRSNALDPETSVDKLQAIVDECVFRAWFANAAGRPRLSNARLRIDPTTRRVVGHVCAPDGTLYCGEFLVHLCLHCILSAVAIVHSSPMAYGTYHALHVDDSNVATTWRTRLPQDVPHLPQLDGYGVVVKRDHVVEGVWADGKLVGPARKTFFSLSSRADDTPRHGPEIAAHTAEVVHVEASRWHQTPSGADEPCDDNATIRYTNGAVYEGAVAEPAMRAGYGTLGMPGGGEQKEGEWQGDRPMGRCRSESPNATCEGQHVQGFALNGRGVVHRKHEGRTFESIWRGSHSTCWMLMTLSPVLAASTFGSRDKIGDDDDDALSPMAVRKRDGDGREEQTKISVRMGTYCTARTLTYATPHRHIHSYRSLIYRYGESETEADPTVREISSLAPVRWNTLSDAFYAVPHTSPPWMACTYHGNGEVTAVRFGSLNGAINSADGMTVYMLTSPRCPDRRLAGRLVWNCEWETARAHNQDGHTLYVSWPRDPLTEQARLVAAYLQCSNVQPNMNGFMGNRAIVDAVPALRDWMERVSASVDLDQWLARSIQPQGAHLVQQQRGQQRRWCVLSDAWVDATRCVVASNGRIYESTALERWMQTGGALAGCMVDPVTGGLSAYCRWTVPWAPWMHTVSPATLRRLMQRVVAVARTMRHRVDQHMLGHMLRMHVMQQDIPLSHAPKPPIGGVSQVTLSARKRPRSTASPAAAAAVADNEAQRMGKRRCDCVDDRASFSVPRESVPCPTPLVIYEAERDDLSFWWDPCNETKRAYDTLLATQLRTGVLEFDRRRLVDEVLGPDAPIPRGTALAQGFDMATIGHAVARDPTWDPCGPWRLRPPSALPVPCTPSFVQARLRYVCFFGYAFVRALFAGTILDRCLFVGCTFTECSFAEATLAECAFYECAIRSPDRSLAPFYHAHALY